MNKILQTLQIFGKNFDKLSEMGKLVIIAILLFAAYSTVAYESGSKLNEFIVQYDELKRNAAITTKMADSLRGQVVDLSNESNAKEEVIKKLSINISIKETKRNKLQDTVHRLEQTIAEAKVDSNLPRVVAYQDTVIGKLKTQLVVSDGIIDDQKNIIKAKTEQTVLLQQSVALSMQRGDSLQAIITKLPATPKNPDKFFGFIPKPSRKVVGAIGFGVGVLAGVQLTK